MLRKLCAVMLTLLLTGAVAQRLTLGGPKTVDFTQTATIIPATYFGLNVGDTLHQHPSVPFGTVITNGRVTWSVMNPSAGVYDWSQLDQLRTFADAHHAELVLILTGTPAWASSNPRAVCKDGQGTCAPPTSMQPWDDFLSALAAHVGSSVKYFAIFNEVQDPGYWCGTVAQMVALTQHANNILKAANPAAKILSPSVTDFPNAGPAWLARFLAAGGGRYVDIISYHGYFDQSAESIKLLQALILALLQPSGAGSLPIWNTEADGAGYNSFALPPPQQPAYIAQTYLLQWSLGIQRFVWYAYDGGNVYGGMVSVDGKGASTTAETPAAMAYEQTYNWMVGATMPTGCVKNGSGTYSCALVRSSYSANALWNSAGSSTMAVPDGYHFLRRLDGTETAVIPGQTITLGSDPVLLETAPLPGQKSNSAASLSAPVPPLRGGTPDLSRVALGQNSDFRGVQIFPGSFRDVSSAEIDTLRDGNFQAVYGKNHLGWNFSEGGDLPYYVIASRHQTDLQCFPVRSGFAVESQDFKVCLRPGMKEEGGWDPFVCHKPSDGGNDRHLTIVDVDTKYALETYQGSVCDGLFVDDSATLWDLTKPIVGQHPYGMTSADVAGLPLLAYSARYDEAVGQGVINHPIRVTVPRSTCAYYSNGKHGLIVAPASHPDNGNCGGQANVTFGDILRLRQDFDISRYPADVRPFLVAWKKWGLSVNDNGMAGLWQGVWDPRWNTAHLDLLNDLHFSDFHIVKPTYKFTAELSPEDDVQGVSIVRDQTAITANAAGNDSTRGPLVKNTPPAPSITSFKVNKNAIRVGESVTFIATYTNGSMAYIDNAGIIIDGTTTDTPQETTDYKLRVQGPNGYTTSRAIHVTVNGTTTVAEPQFSPAPGRFTTAQTISLTPGTAGASTFYTQDGSKPGCSDHPYTGPLTVTVPVTIKAVGCKAGSIKSPVVTATYQVQIPGSTPHIVGTTTPMPQSDTSAGNLITTEPRTFTAGNGVYVSIGWLINHGMAPSVRPTVRIGKAVAALVPGSDIVSTDGIWVQGWWYLPSVAGGSAAVSATWSGTAYGAINAVEVSGSSGVDAVSTGNRITWPKLACGSVATTGTNRLLLQSSFVDTGTSADAGYSQVFASGWAGGNYRELPAATTVAVAVRAHNQTPGSVCSVLAVKP